MHHGQSSAFDMNGEPGPDVVIAGSGPVGAALALLISSRGVSATVITREPSETPVPEPGTSALRPPFRPIALSHASAELLEGLRILESSTEGGDWTSHGVTTPSRGQRSDAVSVTPIKRIHVSQRGRFGRTIMEASDQNIRALGYVVDGSELARVMQFNSSALSRRGEVSSWQLADNGIDVEWMDEDGTVRSMRTRLLVLADGGERVEPSGTADGRTAAVDESWRDNGHGRRRRLLSRGYPQTGRDYGQRAIVCAVRSSVPHDGVAYERFTPEGPLALLPHQDRYAVVWSLPTARAEQLLDCPDALFIAALQHSFGARRGSLSAPGTRLAYPLVLRRHESMQPRVITIGNAAQTLHPVAGQGLNLGLRDAMALADQLSASPRDMIGTDDFVRRYYRHRLVDRAATIAVTDVLARAFAVDYAPAALVRGAALTALDAFRPARNFFVRRMILGTRASP
jgi:2-octaprenyl-6-methoxyphenol hydroxylase